MLCPNGMQGAAKCSGVMRYGRFQPSTHLENIKTKRLQTLNLFFFPALMSVCGRPLASVATCQSCEDSDFDASRPQGCLLCDVAENRLVPYMGK